MIHFYTANRRCICLTTRGEYFLKLGHEVEYFVADSEIRNDPRVHALGQTATLPFNINGNRNPIPLPIGPGKVRESLDEYKPDVLHIQMPHSPFFAGRFITEANAREIAVVGTFHILPHSLSSKFGTHLLRMLDTVSLRHIDEVISNTDATRQFARETFGRDSLVIPCPVDVAKFRGGKKLAKYDDGKINIVFLGRLVERKGCSLLLRALAKLERPELENVRLLIAGKGEERKSLEKQVWNSKLENSVQFLGRVKEGAKPDLLASADIAAFPATSGESFGIVLIEAMAAGAGVVLAGNNPGYSSVLAKTPETLFDPTDIDDFAQKLRLLIREPRQRTKQHELQQKAVGQYDIRVVGPQILEVYRRAIAVRKRPA